MSIAGQIVPPQQESGVEYIEQVLIRSAGGEAADQSELVFGVVVLDEQVEGIYRVAQHGENDLNRDMRWTS